jgi:peptidylprolyl isomerase
VARGDPCANAVVVGADLTPNIIAAMRRSLILLAAFMFLMTACAKEEKRTFAQPLGPSAPPAGFKALTDDWAPSNTKPVVTIPDEAPPTKLEVTDLTVGSGTLASPASTVSVNYLLITWEDKAEVDGSFGGQPLDSPLANLVQGWKEGIPGMKVGGRRQLVIPPALGYGTDPNAHQLGGKTLVFIIDLLAVS